MKREKRLLSRAIKARVVPILWGPPGIGKTALVERVCEELGLRIRSLSLSTAEPSDIAGLPVIQKDGSVDFAPPTWAAEIMRGELEGVFFDELTTAPHPVQAALLKVIHERKVGTKQLPPGTVFVAAANPSEYAGGTWGLTLPMSNRLAHIECQLDAEDWVANFPSYWGKPPVYEWLDETVWRDVRAVVAGFIQRMPQALLKVPKQGENREGKNPYPSPRSWTEATKSSASAVMDGEQLVDTIDYFAMHVGGDHAVMFLEWLREANLPDPRDVLAKADTFPLPTRQDILRVIITRCVALAQEEPDQYYLKAWRIAKRSAEVYKEPALLAARDLAKAHPPGIPIPKEDIAPFVEILRRENIQMG